MNKDSSFLTLPYEHDFDLGDYADEDNRFPSSLVRYFIENYTKKGQRVFDPFAGFGTTIFAAEKLKRVGYGIEIDRLRYEWAASQIENFTNILWGDSAEMSAFELPKMDFAITSPPFMGKNHKLNPLSDEKGYDAYLNDLDHVFSLMPKIMKRGSYVVVHLENIRQQVFTPLVWDAGNVISKHMRLDNEIIVQWQGGHAQTPYTHCLLFKNA